MSNAVSLYAGPGMTTCGPPYTNESIDFRFVVGEGIQTLADNGPQPAGSLRGLLFVPGLESEDPCNDVDAQLVPRTVMRGAHLSTSDQNMIGLAPWPSQTCAKSYLDAAVKSSPTALIFYNPESKDNGSTPSGRSASWDIQDGLGWEHAMKLPVYAIPGPIGLRLMNELALYDGKSGNALPDSRLHGSLEAENCTHLYAMVDLAPNTKVLSESWLVVLSVAVSALFLFFLLYVILKVLQRLRRSLHQGGTSSDSDLEEFVPRRMVVPPQFLSTIPLYRYPEALEVASTVKEPKDPILKNKGNGKQCSPNIQARDIAEPDDMHAIYEELMPEIRECWSVDGRHGPSFSQASCSICLEDFAPRTSLVRELPCTHIFHAECIDTFLSRESCLCPLCKMSVLPTSFFPDQVTGFLQHRGRSQKWIRLERLSQFLNVGESSSSISSRASNSTAQWLNSIPTPALSHAVIDGSDSGQINMTTRQPSVQFPEQQTLQGPEDDIADAHRRELIQQRAGQLLGPPISIASGRDK